MDTATIDVAPLPMPASIMGFSPAEFGQWLNRHLPKDCGNTEFKVAQLCPDISLTHSHCCFSFAYHALLRHPKDTTLLVFGIKGISHFRFADEAERQTVRPGDIWLFNTGNAPLLRHTPAQTPTEMVVLKYRTHRIVQAFSNIDGFDRHLLCPGSQRLARDELAKPWLNDLLTNPLQSGGERLIAEARALEVLARWINPNALCSKPPGTELSNCEQRAVQQAVRLLKQDLNGSVSLNAIARKVGMSHVRLNRCFKKAFGQTVFAWLRQHRLRCAEHYLRDPKWNITDVAHHCGFSSASHFTQAFKAHYNCTPARFRRTLLR